MEKIKGFINQWWNSSLDIDIGIKYRGMRGRKYIILKRQPSGKRKIKFYEEYKSKMFYREITDSYTNEELSYKEILDLLQDLIKGGKYVLE